MNPTPKVNKSMQPGTLPNARLKPLEFMSILLNFGVVGLSRIVERVFVRVSTAREEGERREIEREIISRKGFSERVLGTTTFGWEATGAEEEGLVEDVEEVAVPVERFSAAL